jgi:hypothetical protein
MREFQFFESIIEKHFFSVIEIVLILIVVFNGRQLTMSLIIIVT